MKRFGTYVRREVTDTDFLGMGLNGEYDLSFFLDFEEYRIPGILSVIDGDSLVPDTLLNSLSSSGKPIRPFVAECEDWMGDEYASQAVSSIPFQFEARILRAEEMRDWVCANTDLEEVSPGRFLVREAGTDILGNPTEAEYLTI